MEFVIITGASRGLGKAISTELISSGKTLILVARDYYALSQLKDELNNCIDCRIWIYPIDLSESEVSKDAIVELLEKINNETKNYKLTFINNAGSINPIKKVDQLSIDEVHYNLSVNFITPSLFISYIMKFSLLNDIELKIINISSGAYKKPISCWSLYSSAKAAMKMFLDTARNENLSNEKVKIVSFDPGVMDTDMQREIRSVKSDRFIEGSFYNNLYFENKLLSATIVAKVIKMNLIHNWNVDKDFISIYEYI